MKKSKFAILLTTAALIFGQLAACGGTGDVVETGDTRTDESTESTTAVEYVKPDIDLGGETFTIASHDFGMSYAVCKYTMISHEEQNGDTLNDAVIDMTRKVEDELNVKLELYPLLDEDRHGADKLSRFILAGEDVVQAAFPLSSGLAQLLATPSMLVDLVKPGDTVVLIVPVDIQAPKGRLILPQVQAVRDALDSDALCYVVKESAYRSALANLREKPALVVCDSQVVDLMVRETPADVPCTTFSILFARLKGDMNVLAAGAGRIRSLRPGDRVFIAEACTHHASDDDIGRVKIPRWLAKFVGGELHVTVGAGRDYPADLSKYQLVIHCGSCMLNRRETLRRIENARRSGVPITNYGMAISTCHGVLERVLSPFPEALEAFRRGN